MKYRCLIIGGGASGLMLAARLRLEGKSGLLLEKTARIGTKLLMSGGGRCNITHGGSIKDFIGCYGEAGRHLRKCLYRHSNIELASWLEENGISLADEKGASVNSWDISAAGRIFPASMKSSDVLSLLMDRARQNGWDIRTESGVYDIRYDGADGSWVVRSSDAEEHSAKSLVIASGGITYPETGSDGSVLDLLRGIGVNITEPRSALAPVYAEDYPYEELSGISLSDVTVTVTDPLSGESKAAGRTPSHSMTGDLLFTHRGFSGPVILNISRYAKPGNILKISYGKAWEDLPRRLQRILEKRSCGPSGDIRTTVLAALLASDEFTITSVDDNGMVTAGGISLDEIDMQTMQLKRFPGLYAIGEAIDADGITGGYNLQMCWSTANTAADVLSQEQ